MTYFLRHNPSGLLVKSKAMYGSCVDPKEADKFDTPTEAIAKCPLPINQYTVVMYKKERRFEDTA